MNPLIPDRGVTAQVASQIDRVDRGVDHEVDKMVEDAVGIEIDQEAGATNRVLTDNLIVNQPM